MARDEYGQAIGEQKVVQVFHNQSNHLRLLSIKAPDGSTQVIKTTDEHPFWVAQEEGYLLAKDLAIGHELVTPAGQRLQVVGTERQEFIESIPVFNFEVENAHTYYVTAPGSNKSILVHNDCGDLLGKQGRLKNKLAAWRRYEGSLELKQWSKKYDTLRTNYARGKWRESFGIKGKSYDTPYGRRFVDNAPGIEIKSGYISKTRFIMKQIMKDRYLKKTIRGFEPFWSFSGKGPTGPLKEFLLKAEIPFEHVP